MCILEYCTPVPERGIVVYAYTRYTKKRIQGAGLCPLFEPAILPRATLQVNVYNIYDWNHKFIKIDYLFDTHDYFHRSGYEHSIID